MRITKVSLSGNNNDVKKKLVKKKKTIKASNGKYGVVSPEILRQQKIALLEKMHHSKLFQEYEMLKTLHNMSINVRFEDFPGLTYRFTPPENKSIIIGQPELGIHKLIKVEAMVTEHGIGPATFSEFLDVNGAMEVGANGKPVSAEHKTYKTGINSHTTKKKTVYKQEGPQGFWKMVEVDE